MARPSDAEIVIELEVAASWAQGPRKERLLRFIDRFKEPSAPPPEKPAKGKPEGDTL